MASTAGARAVFEGRTSALSLYRSLMRELKRSGAESSSSKGSDKGVAREYVQEQFRSHQVTQRQHCKASEEMRHLGATYAAYLRHQRLWREVHEEYHAKGERSVRDTANVVGFKLPHDPK